MVDKHY